MDIISNFGTVFFYGSVLGVIFILTLCIFLRATTSPYPIIIRYRNENYFLDPTTENLIEFPSLNEKASLHLSVIVPAYNEEKRLPSMLNECTTFLENRTKSLNFQYEIIVVSDGSTDKTVSVAHKYSISLGCNKVRVLDLERNRGKGGAVRLGMLSARGSLLLFADADGATKFSELTKLENRVNSSLSCNYFKEPCNVEEKLIVSVGSRAHLEEEAIATRSLFRTILMYGFHFLVKLLAVKQIKDTQCGFKLFTRKAARMCFNNMHVEKWAFDVELLYIAQILKIPVSEVSVTWTEIDGSKIVPVWSWVQMGMDLAKIWLHYTIGAWKIKEN